MVIEKSGRGVSFTEVNLRFWYKLPGALIIYWGLHFLCLSSTSWLCILMLLTLFHCLTIALPLNEEKLFISYSENVKGQECLGQTSSSVWADVSHLYHHVMWLLERDGMVRLPGKKHHP